MTTVPVLQYRHVAPDREITPEAFEAHVRWLKDQGFRSIGLAALAEHAAGTRPAPAKSVAITFDGAYADAWVYAHPILKRHGMRAAMFIPTAFPSISELRRLTSEQDGSIADTRTVEFGADAFLSWGEIRTMAGSNVWEFGSLTHTHKAFDEKGRYASAEDELTLSRKTIEDRAKTACAALAWPWGTPVPEWKGRLQACGYRMAFASKAGANGSDPYLLRRIPVAKPELAWLKSRLREKGAEERPRRSACASRRKAAKPRRTPKTAVRA